METETVNVDDKKVQKTTEKNVKSSTTKQEKNKRKRKRQLYKDILTQMEFYFSDSNIRKDKFLQNLLQQSTDGFMPVEIFIQFNKIRSLTTNLVDIAIACSKSDLLEVSEDKKLLRRKLPVPPKTNVDECTVYVEGIPVHTDHKWIQSVFQHFGKINYISLPRFPVTNKPKGFAFVEFDTPREARKACKYFKAQWESVHQSHEESKNMEDENQDHSTKNKRKRGTSESEEDASRKRSRCDTEESEVNEAQTSEKKDDEIKEETKQEAEVRKEELRKSKKKRKRKKKIIQEDRFQLPTLRVMAKVEWKRWKNKYLSLQKAAMSQMKKSLLIDSNMEVKSTEEVMEVPLKEKSKPSSITYKPGAIVILTLPTPVWNLKEFKEKTRKHGDVMYVDGMEGDKVFYIRCSDSVSSESFLIQAQEHMDASGCILSGEEEAKYWEKITCDREKKMTKGLKEKKQNIRGTEKILLKATEKHSKHIRFDS